MCANDQALSVSGSRRRRRKMRTALGVPVIAAVLALVMADMADASYCGAARYLRCRPVCHAESGCCPQQCYTVMKMGREIVYEQQQVTCYQTCYERVCVPET